MNGKDNKRIATVRGICDRLVCLVYCQSHPLGQDYGGTKAKV
jgi:hypothetical protein